MNQAARNSELFEGLKTKIRLHQFRHNLDVIMSPVSNLQRMKREKESFSNGHILLRIATEPVDGITSCQIR
jgi:hypothetical protein